MGKSLDDEDDNKEIGSFLDWVISWTDNLYSYSTWYYHPSKLTRMFNHYSEAAKVELETLYCNFFKLANYDVEEFAFK